MATTIFTILLSVLLLLQSYPAIAIRSPAQKGFTLDLIHRDSPSSPLHNPTSTLSDRIRSSAERSFSRFAHLSSRSAASNGSISALVLPQFGEYLVKIAIGTPAVEYLMLMDTASDLTWAQCLPCTRCSHRPAQIFSPHNSSTFKNQRCNSSLCTDIGHCDLQKRCEYTYVYADRTYAKGTLASETITFEVSDGQSVKIPNINFGCGHENESFAYFNGASGIIGLGGGPLSIVSQLGSLVDYKFSYCLNSPISNSISLLKFGASVQPPVATRKVVKTPLVKPPANETSVYYVALNDISVGKKKLNVPARTFKPTPNGKGGTIADYGGTIIDSGITFTFLALEAYNLLEPALKSAVKLQSVPSPLPHRHLCFSYNDPNDLDGLPNVILHLEGGDWLLPPSNAFVVFAEGVVCSTFIAGPRRFTIIGNTAQQNVYIEYDLKNRMLLLAPTDCSRSI
ncbi:Aspartic proteinase [Nymphaea thermarum]|nr:Aspartic proteinase [Nymphaea thermarum]